MSVRKTAIVLRAAARRDVRDILLYTGDQWGIEQLEAYSEEVNRAFSVLSINPHIGRTHDDIRPGLRSYRVQQHVIYYRVAADTVVVLRILHRKMEAAQHVDER